MSRTRLAVLFGGMSSEHEVSLRSARSVLDAVDPQRFEAVPVGIGRDGIWRTATDASDLAAIVRNGAPLSGVRELEADLVFPVLHGPNGEDGTIQGLLELARVPYVGSGVLASASCMDKAVQKHLIAALAPDIAQVPFVTLDARALQDADNREGAIASIEASLGYPCFTKPANLGSSVGVCKCTDRAQLDAALREAAGFDTKVVVEQGVNAREIELAVLGNGGPETIVSAPGEIILPPGTWYDYETKYVSDVASYAIPADLPPALAQRLQRDAKRAFVALGCSGLARIDFLLDRDSGVAYLNEPNTMPGFTSISMYPKLIEHAGVDYPSLVSRLCDLALARHAERAALRLDR
ncbi:MAG: D-alanine--D-alanine ligase family protein [Nannocystaceae bacterium]|nr:D-alanine--D-alanine ligase [bacterium]